MRMSKLLGKGGGVKVLALLGLAALAGCRNSVSSDDVFLLHAKTFTVAFDANGGKGEMSPQTFYDGAPQNLAENLFTRTGYEFEGWKKGSEGELIANRAKFTATGDTTLVAQWKAKAFKVTFEVDGEPIEIDATFGELLPDLEKIPASNPPHFFAGFWDEKGENCYYDFNGKGIRKWDIDGEATLVARFSEKTPLTVAFNANGGKGEMSEQTFYDGVPQNLAENLFSRTGYEFAGWKKDGDDELIANCAEYVGTSHVELFAQWEAIEYSVTFDANGGEGGSVSPSQYTISDLAQEIAITAPTKTGFAVQSYSVEKSEGGGDAPTVSGTTIAIPAGCYGNFTVKANWEAKAFKVTFKVDGEPIEIDATFGELLPDLEKIPASNPPDFFAGFWDEEGENCYYDFNGKGIRKWDIDGDATLVARFSEKTPLTVAFNANGGKGEMSEQTFYDGVPQNLAENLFSRTGYEFTGWKKDGDDELIANCAEYVGTSDVELFAQWEAIEYSVTFSANSGEGGSVSPSQYSISESAQEIAITAPTKTGFAVKSYSVEKSEGGGDAPTVSDGVLKIPAGCYGNFTVKANWEEKSYAVTLSPNGGTAGEKASETLSFTSSLAAICDGTHKPERTGYDFAGWATTSDATESDCTSGTLMSSLIKDDSVAGFTLYAVWEIQQFAVTFSINIEGAGAVSATVGGKAIASGDKVNYGDKVTFTATPAQYCRFDHWDEDEGAASQTKTETVTGELSVVAQFDDRAHTFEYPIIFTTQFSTLPASLPVYTDIARTIPAEKNKCYTSGTKLYAKSALSELEYYYGLRKTWRGASSFAWPVEPFTSFEKIGITANLDFLKTLLLPEEKQRADRDWFRVYYTASGDFASWCEYNRTDTGNKPGELIKCTKADTGYAGYVILKDNIDWPWVE